MRCAIQFGLLALFLDAALAQTQSGAIEILKKVGEAYKNVSQYEFEADTSTDENGTRAVSHMHFAFKAPDKYRMEGGLGTVFGEGVIVHDGSSLWFYSPKSNQYASIPASALTADNAGKLGELRPQALDYFMTGRYRRAADFIDGAKFLREESVEIAGVKVACYVVTVSPQSPNLTYTWWVDQKRYRVLREDDAGNSAVFTSIKLDEPIRDELFAFEPPAGARKREVQP